jgi:hypothetical protein
VTFNGHPVLLTTEEFNLHLTLMSSPGKAFTRGKYASGSPCPFNSLPPALFLLNLCILFMPFLASMIIIVLRVEEKKKWLQDI